MGAYGVDEVQVLEALSSLFLQMNRKYTKEILYSPALHGF